MEAAPVRLLSRIRNADFKLSQGKGVAAGHALSGGKRAGSQNLGGRIVGDSPMRGRAGG